MARLHVLGTLKSTDVVPPFYGRKVAGDIPLQLKPIRKGAVKLVDGKARVLGNYWWERGKGIELDLAPLVDGSLLPQGEGLTEKIKALIIPLDVKHREARAEVSVDVRHSRGIPFRRGEFSVRGEDALPVPLEPRIPQGFSEFFTTAEGFDPFRHPYTLRLDVISSVDVDVGIIEVIA